MNEDHDGRGGSGKPQQFDAALASVLPQVRAFVRLHLDPHVRRREADSDIVQSACRDLLANPDFDFRGEAALRSYLCQAALHKIRDRRRHWRAGKRDAARMQEGEMPDLDVREVYRTTLFSPLHHAVRAEEVEELEWAFGQLPEHYREALTLSRIAGMPVPQLAQHLGRTETATRMMLSRAMARLTSLLKRE